MITPEEYYGDYATHPDLTAERKANAVSLLIKCSRLEEMARADGVEFLDNPVTHTGVSGEGRGGFRPQDCPIGALHSTHKEGRGVDRYDPQNKIDAWCMGESGKGGKLEQCGIYIEHPSKTNHWSHWTDKPPFSGNRVFYP